MGIKQQLDLLFFRDQQNHFSYFAGLRHLFLSESQEYERAGRFVQIKAPYDASRLQRIY